MFSEYYLHRSQLLYSVTRHKHCCYSNEKPTFNEVNSILVAHSNVINANNTFGSAIIAVTQAIFLMYNYVLFYISSYLTHTHKHIYNAQLFRLFSFSYKN